jgi:2'-5' RNA ligase
VPVALALRLDAAAEALLAARIARLADAGLDGGMATLGYPPHLTVSVHDAEATAPDATALALTLPEHLTFTAIGCFPESRVVFAMPAASAALLDLHGTIAARWAAGLAPHFVPGAFTPHVTLAHVPQAAELERAMALASDGFAALAARVIAIERVVFPPPRITQRRPMQPG